MSINPIISIPSITIAHEIGEATQLQMHKETTSICTHLPDDDIHVILKAFFN